MHVPIPHGLPDKFCLTEKECRCIKVPLYFATLTVENWLNYSTLSKLIIQNTETRSPQNGNEVLASFLADLRKIKNNKKAYFNLFNYCTDVIDFYKRSETKKEFYIAYTQEYNLFQDKKKQDYFGERSANLVTQRAILQKIDNLEQNIEALEKRQTHKPSISNHHSPLVSKEDSTKSVLMRIVESGVQLHNKYIEGVDLTKQEIDIMKISLSHILDLVDLNKYGQIQSIFKENHEKINNKYTNMFTPRYYEFDHPLEVHFRVVGSLCKKDNSSARARAYIHKTIGHKRECKVIDQILNILDEEKFLLQNIADTNLITESDIVSKIWMPLINKVLFVRDNLVRTKVGETISQHSQEEKMLQYDEKNKKNIKAFKVDIRFIFDLDGKEHDVGAGEVARETADKSKILHDKSKLLREGKDVLDGILKTVIVESSAQKAVGHAIQIKGLCAQVISIYLTNTGLYVAIPVFKIYFPICLRDLSDFIDGLKNVFRFVDFLCDNAKLYESAIISRKRRISSIDFDYNTQQRKLPAHSLIGLIKPTYYSPINNDRFYSVFDLSNTEGSKDTPSPKSDVEENGVSNPDADENGWIMLDKGKWFHREANITLNNNPYE